MSDMFSTIHVAGSAAADFEAKAFNLLGKGPDEKVIGFSDGARSRKSEPDNRSGKESGDGIVPGLAGVSETMLWALYNRASEARRHDGILVDPESVRIHGAIELEVLTKDPEHSVWVFRPQQHQQSGDPNLGGLNGSEEADLVADALGLAGSGRIGDRRARSLALFALEILASRNHTWAEFRTNRNFRPRTCLADYGQR